MIWGTDRIDSGFASITALSTKPQYVLTFNEPNYAFGGGSPTNVVDPVTAAGLWPQIVNYATPLGIQLIAPSPIDCTGNPDCFNVGTAAGWLSAFQSVSCHKAAAGALVLTPPTGHIALPHLGGPQGYHLQLLACICFKSCPPNIYAIAAAAAAFLCGPSHDWSVAFCSLCSHLLSSSQYRPVLLASVE